MQIIGIIPARYASSRFPGKPLIDIKGKSMIRRVYEQAAKAKLLSDVIVATDDQRIADEVLSFNGKFVMTDSGLPSGTDRCNAVLEQLGAAADYVINIQGDEPFIIPEQIDELASLLDGSVELATQMIAVKTAEELWDEGEVKITLNSQNEALYFSRMVIPYIKSIPRDQWHLKHLYYRHVGMYAYRSDVLKAISKLPVSLLEKAESLEQLRWLEQGYKIKCVNTTYESHCVDTPEDLERILKTL